MNIKISRLLLLTFSVLILLAGCATTGNQQATIERITPEQLAKILPQPVANLSLDEIIKLSQQGISADEIIAQIKLSNSRYELSPSQTLDLSKKGVETKVLDFMHDSNELAKQNAVADELNKREQAKLKAQKEMQRQLEMQRSNAFCDPFWPNYGCYPYGYSPFGFRHYPFMRGGGGLRFRF